MGSVCAAIFTLSSPLHAGVYSYDNGVSHNHIGLSAGGEVAAIQAFPTIAGQDTILTISMAFGTASHPGDSGIVGGDPL